MIDCKPVSTPMETSCKLTKADDSPEVNQSEYRSMIGSLLYLTASRPDLMHAVCLVSRFQSAPKQSHLIAVKRILKYIQDDRKSTSGAAFFLGDRLVAWHSKKQECVTLSTAESEYIAATACCTQLIWMSYQLADMGITVLANEFQLLYVPSQAQVADIFTKALSKEVFEHFRDRLF
ncbi:secreted RxLR effector protein 161-like [Cryptomeria japonica]|uniref:secreted RxLR effector protein 161-like n=1 Tax=Cryptomeria japonica TaxID=3369 RepID=UPI0027DA6689|nr:secreted RxLR effector protein 161-like [Cryptomeria japonica]